MLNLLRIACLVTNWCSHKIGNSVNNRVTLFTEKDEDCSNFLRISFLSIAYKIIASILCEILKPHLIRSMRSY
uniref:Uncharacterized protein n=1 Tax=Megaselia scalaris TaxID=36166 RepID=T1GBW6_MEGSC